MRTKTKYRQSDNSDIPPDDFPADIPESKINGAEPALVEAVSIPPEPAVAEPAPEAVAQAEAKAAQADEAAYALKRQIDAMRQAEQIQRQQHLEYQRIATNRPLGRDEKLEQWKTQGLTAREALFLRERPHLIDHPEIVSFAANEALAAGIERDTSDYWRAIEQGFDKHMNRLRVQAEAVQPTPKFFEPPPAPQPRKASPASFVSAPVSREVPSSTPRPVDPRRVDLSVEEQQIAAASGISVRQYAEGKLRLMKEKADGTRQ